MAPHDEEYVIKDATPVVSDKEGIKSIQLRVRLHGYKSHEIEIRPEDCDLHIISRDNRVLKTFHLPESVDPFTIEASMKEEGILVIEAPMIC